MAKRGRPTKYNKRLAKKICGRIASSEDGLHKVCKEEGMPSVSTVFNWLHDDEHSEFLDMYNRARVLQAELMKDNIISIADDGSKDTIIKTTQSGETFEIENREWTNRSKLRVDARKWTAARLSPRIYGDKIDVTSKGDKVQSTPVVVQVLTDEQKNIVDGIK